VRPTSSQLRIEQCLCLFEIRCVETLGKPGADRGEKLAHADPHMDLPPMLIALDARVPAREREIANSPTSIIRRYVLTS
jgi:hypothetical protein